MMYAQENPSLQPDHAAPPRRGLEVRLVDNWHARWRDVLAAIDAVGQRHKLNVEIDGWLPARHNLLVAFDDHEAIAGHLSFRVQPVCDEHGQVLMHLGRPMVEAHLESLGVQPGFSRDEVEQMLRAAAERRAAALRCRKLVGI